MRVAHILPPRVAPRVNDLLSDHHLILPSLVTNETYRQFYRDKTTSDWVTLDNGVAEGHLTSFGHLLSIAKATNVQEVVLPDVLYDQDKTLDYLVASFYEAFKHRFNLRFMFVPQGKTINEIIQCAEQAFNMCPGIISTIGIPRHILSEGIAARAQIVWALRERIRGPFEIHLLGTHPGVVEELIEMGRDFKDAGVRSVDTSLAWNAMLESAPLKEPKCLSYNLEVRRQPIAEFAKAYFEPGFEEAQEFMLRSNMEAINTWVK